MPAEGCPRETAVGEIQLSPADRTVGRPVGVAELGPDSRGATSANAKTAAAPHEPDRADGETRHAIKQDQGARDRIDQDAGGERVVEDGIDEVAHDHDQIREYERE